MSRVIVINSNLVKQLLTMKDAIGLVEQAYSDYYLGKSKLYPAVRESVEEFSGIFGIKSSYLIESKIIGLKAGGFLKSRFLMQQASPFRI